MSDSVRLGDRVRLAALVAFAAAAAVGLHRLGAQAHLQVDWGDVAGWAVTRSVEDVVAAAARLAGLALAYWVLTTSSLYVLARLSRVPAAVRAVRWAALPPVRRLADRVVAATLTSSAVLAGPAAAAAAAQPPAAVVVDSADADVSGYEPIPVGGEAVAPRLVPPGGPPLPSAPHPVRPQPAPEPEDEGARTDVNAFDVVDQAAVVSAGAPPADAGGAAVDRRAGGMSADPAVEEQRYTVVAGDHLWGIAQRTLTAAWDRPPSTGEVDGYWRQLMAANAASIASGDPDLIYPGEVLTLPVVPESKE